MRCRKLPPAPGTTCASHRECTAGAGPGGSAGRGTVLRGGTAMPDTMTMTGTTSRAGRMGGRVAYNPRPEHTEGMVARTIEEQTAKLPSDLFLWAAGASILGSLC